MSRDKKTIWIVDDDRSIRWVLKRSLENANYEVVTFENADSTLNALHQHHPHALISDIRMPGQDGLYLLERLRSDYPDIPVIIITAHSDLDAAIAAYQGGAFEYLPKPFDVDEAVELVRRACQPTQLQATNSRSVSALQNASEIIGEASAMQEVFRAIGRLARSNITVLITGESGTGKELVAHALHRHSPRSRGPYIALNTAAIPSELLESELFGHERGAFTGAQSQRHGRFEQANGGTLFLDEIGDMPAELQTRLLRVLADGEFYRVGGHSPIRVDVRIIAATHQDLEQRVKNKLFREDLYHRLNVIRIRIPPLHERHEDIPLLLDHFLKQAAIELDTDTKRLRPEVSEHLSHYHWPGNVRELENICRWLTVMAAGNEVHMEDLPPELHQVSKNEKWFDWEEAMTHWAQQSISHTQEPLLNIATPRMERILINTALRFTNGRRQDAAKLLGWGRNTLTRKINELNIPNKEYQGFENEE